ncbi:MAG: TetR/AcrR family transcriptional regulator [Planctomycetaceae bacterium]|jgi:AcrR family transcriptional regulator|nr:TetR/AcrR family transcriptional regulator [Planctomycetaceae bacterium]
MTILVDHEQRKTIILENAFALFAEEGYNGVTYQKIADRCGISRTSIYKYFQNKEQIFDYAIKQATGKMENLFQRIRDRKDWSSLEKLQRFLHLLAKTLSENNVFLTVLLEYLLSQKQAGNDIRRKVRRHTLGIKFVLNRLLQEAIENKDIAPLADPSKMTNHLYGILESLVLNISITDLLDWRDAVGMIDDYLEQLQRQS